MTKPLKVRFVPRLTLAPERPPSLSDSVESSVFRVSAGTMPAMPPARSDAQIANASTRMSSCVALNPNCLPMLEGSRVSAKRLSHVANRSPQTHPSAASNKLSISIC